MGDFARELWRRLESLHAVTYFAPEPVERAASIGVKGFWRTYFGFRGAPLGACSAATAQAAFFGFAPDMVARAVPSVWGLAMPDALIGARAASAATALRRLAPTEVEALARDAWATGVLVRAIELAPAGNLPLFLANRDLALRDDPVEALWQLTTTLREQRGDGHVANWTSRGCSPLDVAVLFVGAGGTSRDALQPNRGWTDDEWHEALERNEDAGLLTSEGVVTDAGAALIAEVEDATDRLAEAPFRELGDEDRARLLRSLTPAAMAVTEANLIPQVNPMGVPLLGD